MNYISCSLKVFCIYLRFQMNDYHPALVTITRKHSLLELTHPLASFYLLVCELAVAVLTLVE